METVGRSSGACIRKQCAEYARICGAGWSAQSAVTSVKMKPFGDPFQTRNVCLASSGTPPFLLQPPTQNALRIKPLISSLFEPSNPSNLPLTNPLPDIDTAISGSHLRLSHTPPCPRSAVFPDCRNLFGIGHRLKSIQSGFPGAGHGGHINTGSNQRVSVHPHASTTTQCKIQAWLSKTIASLRLPKKCRAWIGRPKGRAATEVGICSQSS